MPDLTSPPPENTPLAAPRQPIAPPIALHQVPPPQIYENARFKKVACAGLYQKYDGSPEGLIPMLNLIHLQHQNEVWCTATYHEQEGGRIDMIQKFSKVSLASIQCEAAKIWDDPLAHIHWHTRGMQAYCSRLFGLFLLNSMTPDFTAMLHSRSDQKYSSDGPLILVTLCNHVHRKQLAFVESIKNKIRTNIMQDHGNDVPQYL
jgi:hypothetical protein